MAVTKIHGLARSIDIVKGSVDITSSQVISSGKEVPLLRVLDVMVSILGNQEVRINPVVVLVGLVRDVA